MSTIKQFIDQYEFLSNFHPSPIEVEGKTYATVEHYYQSMKAVDSIEAELIRTAKTPYHAKKLGQKCAIKNNWEKIKIDFMEIGLRVKFKYTHLKEALLSTKGREIQEGNNWGDTIWGVDLKTGEGNNYLGQLLMKIRDEMV